jgi:pyroglutamyl-peptidase
VLPTAYDKAVKEIVAVIRETRPSLVLGLGVSTSRDKICLERFALNLDDAAIADNIGCFRRGEEIVQGGPAALKTKVDISAILSRLVDAGVRAEISNHGGTFVCNHVYYRVLRRLEQERSRARCLFVHVPMPVVGRAPNQVSSKMRWRMADLQQAVFLILAELVRQRGDRS